MRSSLEMQESISAVRRVLRRATAPKNRRWFKGIAEVSATVKDRLLIDRELVNVDLTHDGHNRCVVDIYWEESGYKQFRTMGLYGRMSTDFQLMEFIVPCGLKIVDEKYTIQLQFAER